MDLDIRHEEVERRGAFRAFDEEGPLGSVVYVRSGAASVLIQHTGVEERARGKGVGRALFEHVVAWARENETRLTVQCPYMQKMFRQNPDMQDVLR